MLTQYQTPAIVMSAHKLGIFRELEAGAASLEDLALRLRMPERSLGILLRACVVSGLLILEDGRFAPSPLAAETLVPELQATWAVLWTRKPFSTTPGASCLPVFARARQLWLLLFRAREEPETTRNFLLALDDVAVLFGGEFAQQLDLTGCRRLLDVGGGVGSYAISLVERFPDLESHGS